MAFARPEGPLKIFLILLLSGAEGRENSRFLLLTIIEKYSEKSNLFSGGPCKIFFLKVHDF